MVNVVLREWWALRTAKLQRAPHLPQLLPCQHLCCRYLGQRLGPRSEWPSQPGIATRQSWLPQLHSYTARQRSKCWCAWLCNSGSAVLLPWGAALLALPAPLGHFNTKGFKEIHASREGPASSLPSALREAMPRTLKVPTDHVEDKPPLTM